MLQCRGLTAERARLVRTLIGQAERRRRRPQQKMAGAAHQRRCAVGACHFDRFAAAVLPLFELVLHRLRLSEAPEALCLYAGLRAPTELHSLAESMNVEGGAGEGKNDGCCAPSNRQLHAVA